MEWRDSSSVYPALPVERPSPLLVRVRAVVWCHVERGGRAEWSVHECALCEAGTKLRRKK